ncbi:MAG TPA: glycosyltransferase, partial [Hanamia sp.]|nr:glycosyltransferase [Hanamia sp.]
MHEAEPKISIITVCLNAVSTIDSTIKSVLSQTFKNIEYLVIDGASTD